MDINQLKYPIGKYETNKNPTENQLKQWVDDIEALPDHIKKEVSGLSTLELNYTYRPGGWTIKQVVHHCADSHLNCIIRFKLALTENDPTIRPYFEDRWAQLPDSLEDDISHSLQLLASVHYKLILLLRSLTPDQLKREFIHPEYGKKYNLAETIGNYAWHGNHHLAHIKQAIVFKNNF